jgi:glutaredoxin
MNIMNKIEIYTNENCSYCKQIKEELNNNSIEFEEKPTKDNVEGWQDIVNLTGVATVPTVKYNDEYFIPTRDFNSPQQLIAILKGFKKSKFSESKQILEKIKTLNSNINIAFIRLDQLLRQIETNTKKE